MSDPAMYDGPDTDRVASLLERTLTSRAAQAPTSSSLARRARAGRRRTVVVRSSVAVAAAFGVAAAIAVPTVVTGGSDPTTPANTGVSTGPATEAYFGLPPVQPVPDGWRWETYGGMELQVPADWYTGATHQPWCAGDPKPVPEEPYVDRPGPVAAIACIDQPMDQWGPHVDFGVAGPAGREELGGGWIRETRQLGAEFVAVQTDDETLLGRILDSARTVTELDAVGCPVDYAVTQSLDARPTTGALDPQQVGPDGVVCQYALHESAGATGLRASYRLTADEVRTFVDAVAAAPVGSGPSEPSSCSTDYRRGESALVVRLATTDGARDVIVWYAGCVNGADDGVTERTLTAGMLAPLFHGSVFASSGNMVVVPLMPSPSS